MGAPRRRVAVGGSTHSSAAAVLMESSTVRAPLLTGRGGSALPFSSSSSSTSSSIVRGAPAFAYDAFGPLNTGPGGAGGDDEEEAQALVLNGERIAVPEALFRPSDVSQGKTINLGPPTGSAAGAASGSGGDCSGGGGLHYVIAAAIAACPPALQPALWGSIVLVGGNARMAGLESRLAAELRPLAPSGLPIRLHTPRAPEEAAYRGGVHLASQPGFAAACVTKEAWAREGARATRRAFRTRAGPAETALLAGGRGGRRAGGGGDDSDLLAEELEAAAAVDVAMAAAAGGGGATSHGALG